MAATGPMLIQDQIAGTYRNLRRAGFEEAYESRNWQRPALHPARIY